MFTQIPSPNRVYFRHIQLCASHTQRLKKIFLFLSRAFMHILFFSGPCVRWYRRRHCHFALHEPRSACLRSNSTYRCEGLRAVSGAVSGGRFASSGWWVVYHGLGPNVTGNASNLGPYFNLCVCSLLPLYMTGSERIDL